MCRFEIVGGVCAGYGWGDGSRMEHSAIAAPRCRAVRIISHLLFGCAIAGLLFYFPNVKAHERALARSVPPLVSQLILFVV
jgi:hypothetical protein